MGVPPCFSNPLSILSYRVSGNSSIHLTPLGEDQCIFTVISQPQNRIVSWALWTCTVNHQKWSWVCWCWSSYLMSEVRMVLWITPNLQSLVKLMFSPGWSMLYTKSFFKRKKKTTNLRFMLLKYSLTTYAGITWLSSDRPVGTGAQGTKLQHYSGCFTISSTILLSLAYASYLFANVHEIVTGNSLGFRVESQEPFITIQT